ncbi:MAG: hypothetical protein II863_18385, partial [Kiritimatiellae bacterium]|nr:hypothetical protein [Kiritimatiellia bacterium]
MPEMILSLIASIVVSTNSVTLTAVSTDCGLDAQIEFFLAGPDSDHDYEAMVLAEDSVKDIAAAFEKAGMPLGKPAS